MFFGLLVPCFRQFPHALTSCVLFHCFVFLPPFFLADARTSSHRFDMTGKELASLVDHGRTQGCRGGPRDGLTILHVGQERVSAILLRLLVPLCS